MTLVTTILMATGKVGKATINELQEKYKEKVEIRAATRDPESVPESLKNLEEVKFVKAHIGGDKEDMKKALDGTDSLFILLPDVVEDPVDDVFHTMEAAKEAGVKHVLLQSGVFADIKPDECNCVLAKQYYKYEQKVKEIFPDAIILRLAFFYENNFSASKSVKAEGKMYGPSQPDALSPYMAASDAGKAAAAILAGPEEYKGNTFTLVNESISGSDLAKALGEAIEKEVVYEAQPYDEWSKKLLGFGMAEWMVNNYVELFRMEDDKHPSMAQPKNQEYENLTGTPPTTTQEWCAKHADAFK